MIPRRMTNTIRMLNADHVSRISKLRVLLNTLALYDFHVLASNTVLCFSMPTAFFDRKQEHCSFPSQNFLMPLTIP